MGMIESVKYETKPKEAQIHHQRLIKVIVDYQLKTNGMIWKYFIIENKFVEKAIEHKLKPVHKLEI